MGSDGKKERFWAGGEIVRGESGNDGSSGRRNVYQLKISSTNNHINKQPNNQTNKQPNNNHTHNNSFYQGAAKLDAFEFFKRFAVGPDALPDIIFASVGRTLWKDVGGVALGFRCVVVLCVWCFKCGVCVVWGVCLGCV